MQLSWDKWKIDFPVKCVQCALLKALTLHQSKTMAIFFQTRKIHQKHPLGTFPFVNFVNRYKLIYKDHMTVKNVTVNSVSIWKCCQNLGWVFVRLNIQRPSVLNDYLLCLFLIFMGKFIISKTKGNNIFLWKRYLILNSTYEHINRLQGEQHATVIEIIKQH